MPATKSPSTSTKASRSAAFALAAGKTTLGNGIPGVTMVEAEGSARFSVKGADYATIDVAGDGVSVALRPAPADVDAMRATKRFAEERDGWFRIQLTRAARDWLDVDMGSRAGRAIRWLRDGT